MNMCEYGCEGEATYQLKNGKWCCSEKWQSCPSNRKRVSKQVGGKNNPLYGKKHSSETKEKIRIKSVGKKAWNKGIQRSDSVKNKISKKLKGRQPWNKGKTNIYSKETLKKMRGRIVKKETRKKLRKANILTIEKIILKYPFFSKVEEMRYNPDKPGEKEIQVHCKNHNCSNSKEQEGWFTPTGHQFDGRRRALEDINGNDGSYLYCCDKCKNTCSLYNLTGDPFKKNNQVYNQQEYKQFREFVLKRDNHICQYCGEKAEHVHHERPQKLEPFFALDPDLAWSVCKKCHYEKGHKDECSTGNLANKVCI